MSEILWSMITVSMGMQVGVLFRDSTLSFLSPILCVCAFLSVCLTVRVAWLTRDNDFIMSSVCVKFDGGDYIIALHHGVT